MGAEDAAALKALSREVAEAQAALAPLEEGAAGLRARAVGLEKAVEDAGGAPVKRQRARVAQLKEARAPVLALSGGSLCSGCCDASQGAGQTSAVEASANGHAASLPARPPEHVVGSALGREGKAGCVPSTCARHSNPFYLLCCSAD